MQHAAVAGTRGRQGGLSVPQDARDTAAPHAARVQIEPIAENGDLEDGAQSVDEQEMVGERSAVPPPIPPDAPTAMTEQALESWSLIELFGVPGLGRLLSAVHRTSG